MIEPLESRQLFASTFYVAPRGNDANPGTRTRPWRTIQYAADRVRGGQTIVVLAGTYHERVVVKTGGSKSRGFVTFRGNNGAVISAEGVAGDHQILISGKQYVTVTGFELADNTVADDGSGIRLEGWGHKIRIFGNTIHHTRGESAMAVTVYGSDAKRGFSSVAIDDNVVYDCEPAPSEAIVVNGNVRDFSIRGNDVRDVNNIAIDAIGGEGICGDASVDAARNGTIAANTIARVRSRYEDGYAAGIYVDGGRDIVVERNCVSQSDLGIEIGAENPGTVTRNVTVKNNLLLRNDKAGLAIGGYDADRGRVVDSIVRNNTFFQNDQAHAGNGELWVQYANDCSFMNNAIVANAQALVVNVVAPTSGNRFDFNIFSTTSASVATFSWRGKEQSFATWQKAGRDATSRVTDPKFADYANDDFRPATGSSLVDAGDPATSLSNGELDLLGSDRKRDAIDVGAIER